MKVTLDKEFSKQIVRTHQTLMKEAIKTYWWVILLWFVALAAFIWGGIELLFAVIDRVKA